MGARGPAPTPTKILEARGSWRAKARAGELTFPVERPECPAWLSTEARAEWDRVVERLEGAGVLAQQAYARGESPAELRRKGTSPKGTTEAAITVFEKHNLGEILSAGFERARQRSMELSKEVEGNN